MNRKKEKVSERRSKAMNNITQRYHDRCANRIIKLFRKIVAKKKLEQEKIEATKTKAIKRSANLIAFEKERKEEAQEHAQGSSSYIYR